VFDFKQRMQERSAFAAKARAPNFDVEQWRLILT
jgi:hypothetical protein